MSFDFTLTITAGLVRQFAEATGDWNPIHFDDNAARRVGLPGRCAHGLLILGYAAQRLALEDLSIHRITAQYTRAAGVGETIHFRFNAQAGGFDWTAESTTGERVASGRIVVQ
jgi:acyl dehydratase